MRNKNLHWFSVLLPVVLGLLVVTLANGATPIAKSTFDVDDEGWTIVGEIQGPPEYSEVGGNPGGHIFVEYNLYYTWYFRAPSKFYGDVSAAYGQTLTFDLQQLYTDYQITTSDDVILTGAGITLVFDTPYNPGSHWTAYGIPLNESAGWIKWDTGEQPSQEEMIDVLSSLESLQIRGEFRADYWSSAITGLDNVVLNGIDPLGSIEGYVTDCQTGAPIEGVLVIATQKPTKVSDFTDENGYYKLVDLEPGVWLLIGIKKGYKPHIARVKVEAGKTTRHDFCMEPK